MSERPVLGAVLAWATAHHASQRRTFDNAPFIVHPLEVASMLSARGYEDDVVAAGLLHDVVEQADVSLADVRERFGGRVADLVAAVTEDEGIADYDARKAALRERMAAAGPQAHAIYAADKIAKVRELRAQAMRTAEIDPQQLAHYELSLDALALVAPGLPMVDQLAFELWALRAFAPT
ncbi:HD domain-containing protein [Solirubrobacter taibaiensis]|nr:HD domain-containing protein [Solirubrobacter taibaiensis]